MAKILVTLKVHDIIKDKINRNGVLADGKMQITIPEESMVGDLIDLLDLTDDWVGLITVNKRQSTPEKPLSDGDVVELFSPLVGG